MGGYRVGKGLVENMDLGLPQNMLGTEILNRNPSVMDFTGIVRSMGPPPLDRVAPPATILLRPAQCLASPQKRLESHMASQSLMNPMPLRRFPNVRANSNARR
jgi:hypothetical protein